MELWRYKNFVLILLLLLTPEAWRAELGWWDDAQ